MFFYSPVYARDVYHYVDHVAAQLVALHVYRAGVGGNIDLGEDVEEEDLLRAAVGSKQVQEALEGAHLRDQALDDLKRNKSQIKIAIHGYLNNFVTAKFLPFSKFFLLINNVQNHFNDTFELTKIVGEALQ